MMKKMIRRSFNLVEIALATAVIGIGLSSVLILFPIGLNAGKASVADNNLGDVAELVFGFIQTQYQLNWNSAGTRTGLAANCPVYDATPDDSDIATGASDFLNDDGTPKNKTAVTGLVQHPSQAGIFLFQQRVPDAEAPSDRSRDNIEFEAIIRVGVVQNNIDAVNYPELGTGNWPAITADGNTYQYQTLVTSGNIRNNLGGASSSEASRKYLTSMVVEISWPIDAPWSQREKRVFVLDMFNEKFQPSPLP